MSKRSDLAARLREDKAHDMRHVRYNVIGLRYQGGETGIVLTLTVPVAQRAELADAFERNQKYTCQVRYDGAIVFRPVDDPPKQCESQVGPNGLRCVLVKGHRGQHENTTTKWTNRAG